MQFVHFDSTAAPAPSKDKRQIVRRRAAQVGRSHITQPLVHLEKAQDTPTTRPGKTECKKLVLRWRYRTTSAKSSDTELSGEDLDSRPSSPRPESCQIVSLRSPNAFREQVYSTYDRFLYPLDFPKTAQPSSVHRPWLEPLTPSMTAAIDCLYLIHLEDAVLKVKRSYEADRQYSIARQLLIKELRDKDARESDGVLAAIDILARLCAVKDRQSPSCSFTEGTFTPKDYACHINGELAVIRARGPSILDSEFSRNMVINLLPITVMRAIVERKPSFFAEPQWVRALEPYCHTVIRKLMLIGITIPRAMQRKDGTLSELHAGIHLVALREQIARLQELMQSWYLSAFDVRPTENPITDFPNLKNNIKHFLTSGCPFNNFLKFRGDEDAIVHLTYWTLLLSLQQCIAELVERHPTVLLAKQQTDEKPEQDCTVTADLICRSVAHFNASKWPVVGAVIVNDTLEMARVWYARRGIEEKEGWCRAVLGQLGRGGEVLKPERILCGARPFMLLEN